MSKLSQDLVAIRKFMRLNKQNVFEKCRVPMETIESIEDGSIFSGKTRNKTYLRSYLRTYAKAIGIKDDDIVKALDDQEENGYTGDLGEKYLPDTSGDTTKATSGKSDSSGSKSKSGDTSSQGKKEKKGVAGKTGQDDTSKTSADANNTTSGNEKKSKIITPESQEKSIEDVEWEDQTLKKPFSTSTSDFASSESHGDVTPKKVSNLPKPPDLDSVDWATKVKDAVYRPQKNRLLWVIVAIILALALAMASVFWFWQYENGSMPVELPAGETSPITPADEPDITGDPEITDEPGITGDPVETETETPETTTPETSAISPGEGATQEEITRFVLAETGTDDTLHVIAYALHGNLEPIRVHSDVFGADEEQVTTLRPYWVEQREAMRFEFVDEIIFQGALSRLVLIFNGHIIDDFSNLHLEGPRISLTRDHIMENEELQTPATNPFSDIPAPLAVADRPRFTP